MNFLINKIRPGVIASIMLQENSLVSKDIYYQFLTKAKSISPLVFSVYIPSIHEYKVAWHAKIGQLNRKIIEESAALAHTNYLYMSFEKV